jgi:hypothetical protein
MRTIFGYLDPGSGSMLLQMLVGGAAAASVTLRLFWRRLRSGMRIRKKDGAPEQDSL